MDCITRVYADENECDNHINETENNDNNASNDNHNAHNDDSNNSRDDDSNNDSNEDDENNDEYNIIDTTDDNHDKTTFTNNPQTNVKNSTIIAPRGYNTLEETFRIYQNYDETFYENKNYDEIFMKIILMTTIPTAVKLRIFILIMTTLTMVITTETTRQIKDFYFSLQIPVLQKSLFFDKIFFFFLFDSGELFLL